jgi:tRNA (guanine37-N1)-methyltransferase
MFSGCAPYPVVLARHTKARSIIGIEINPTGHKYGLKNLTINNVSNAQLICGDVAEIVPSLAKQGIFFDRIIMPLPKSAGDYLKEALQVAKKDTIIHFYAFAKEEEFEDLKKDLVRKCASMGKECLPIATTPCGQHAPRVFRVCIDLSVR